MARVSVRRQRFESSSTMSSGASEGKSPADFLKAIKGKKVSVKLNSGVDYRGTHAVVVGAFERCDCPDADG